MNGSEMLAPIPAPALSHLLHAMEVSPSLPNIQAEEEEDHGAVLPVLCCAGLFCVVGFLKRLLGSRSLHALVKAHDTILLTNVEIGPSISNAAEISEQVKPYRYTVLELRHNPAGAGAGRHPAVRHDVRGRARALPAAALSPPGRPAHQSRQGTALR